MSLQEPFLLGPHRLSNRVVLAPLGCGGDADPLDADRADHYARQAHAGLLVSELADVDIRRTYSAGARSGLSEPGQVESWRRVVDRVHLAGGRVFARLSHAGRATHPLLIGGDTPVAPSAIAGRGMALSSQGLLPFTVPRALAVGEISGIVSQFANAAILALEAGFDGVEVQAANGHLIDQFLRSGSNKRDDAYGGTVQNRVRLLLEVTEAIAGIWGSQQVGVRLSPYNNIHGMSDRNPAETFFHAAEALDQLGIVYLNVIEPAGGVKRLIPRMRERFGGALIASGGYDRASAEDALSSGIADLVLLSRQKPVGSGAGASHKPSFLN